MENKSVKNIDSYRVELFRMQFIVFMNIPLSRFI